MFSRYVVGTGLVLLVFGSTISACADSSSVDCNSLSDSNGCRGRTLGFLCCNTRYCD